MKKSIFYLLAIGIFIAGTSCSQKGIKSVKLENNVDSVSYAIGILVGEQNAQQLENAPSGDELNKDILISAFSAALKKDETKMTLDDAQGIIRTFFETASKKEAQKNLEEGNAFLEENKKRDSVITTESGLQYEIITEGTGKKPSADDRVKVNYEGKLIDGTVFDSSVERGKPAEFTVNQVIPGWTEALQLMPVGSKWKVYIPSSLGYGERGAGPNIAPNSTLIFEVELLDIIKE